jgi:hypothetical protein
VVRRDHELLELRRVVRLALELPVLVRGEDRALDEARRVGVMGDLPAQRAGAELARPAGDGRGGHPRALAVEVVALAEPHEHVAEAAGVRDGELAQARAGLAGVDQALEHPVDVVGDPLSFEDADGDRVGAGVGR